MSRSNERNPGRSYLVFRIDGVEQVMEAGAIREVMKTRSLEAISTADDSPVCFSLVSQGVRVPVVRLGRPRDLHARSRVIVLANVAVGLLVDSVSRMELVPPQCEAEGRVRLGGKWRAVLNPNQLAQWALARCLDPD